MHDELDLNMEPNEPSNPDVGGTGPVDHEGAMAKADLYKLANYSLKLFKKIQEGDQLESWVQAKITKAADYIASVYHYLEYEMQFSEYGKQLDNSDILSESRKTELKNKLIEARAAIKQLKLTQAEKQFGKVDEGHIFGGGEQPCAECGGTGVVMVPEKSIPEELKGKIKTYNRKAKAMAAAVKRVDANKNGIPDDEEFEESAADEPAAPDADLIAKRKAREAAQRRREEKEEADYDDLSKDIKPKGEKSSGTKKVAGKAYGGSAQKDDSDVEESQGSVYGQGVYEGKSKKAKKDYDKDGKIESEKDEVIGSRRKAAGLDESRDEDEDDYEPYGGEDDPDDYKPKKRPVPAWYKGPSTPKKVKEAAEEKRAPAVKRFETDSQRVARLAKEKRQAEKKKEAEKKVDESTGDYSAKKGAAGKDLGKPGKNFAKIAKKAEKGGAKSGEAVAGAVLKKLRAKNEDQSAPLTPQQAAELAKSSDPNAYNKLKGIPTPKTTTPVVSPDEGPTKASKPAVVKESSELDRIKEFLTRLNG